MSVVIDASLALCAAFMEDDGAASVLESCVERGALVPALWLYEVTSGIRNAVRRRRATEAEARALLDDLADMRITVISPDGAHARRTFDLSMRFDISTYHATYIDLALREKTPLATRDRGLADVAVTLGIPLA